MLCYGCYKPNIKGYCLACRKQLFDGKRVQIVLPFDTPKAGNLEMFQEKTKRLSISGVQLKYSLKLEGKELELTEKDGRYILKPIPPSTQLVAREQAPENEHLTMQIAAQLFSISTAANCLIYFKDGSPAYLTRRFDVRSTGGKYQQEDMAQLSGRSRDTLGEHFKYDGTYEEIGRLIEKYVAAYPPALEQFFRLVIFNYLFSNGDAHLKNFSLIQTEMGDYTLSPAYDLMCTVLHTPLESDTALDLYKDSIDSPFYKVFGYYGQADFRTLADKIGILPLRRDRILTQMLSATELVLQMVQQSSLSEEAKRKYIDAYMDKVIRMGMTKDMIARAMNPQYPGVYSVTNKPTKLTFLDRKVLAGFFDQTDQSNALGKENKYTFIEMNNSAQYRETRDMRYVTLVEGDLLQRVEFPAKG
jgi:serine/threonine-protein kinase HipA